MNDSDAAEHLRILLDHQRNAETAASAFARHVAALPTIDIQAIHQHALVVQPGSPDGLGMEVTSDDLDALRSKLADELEARAAREGNAPSALTVEAYEEVREAHEPSNNGNF